MYSLGIDIGTTSCKLCILSSNENNRLIFNEQLAHQAHISQDDFPHFDEQDASKILQTIDQLLAQSNVTKDVKSIKSIQICGQMHGIILWSSKSPRSIVSPLITWQDQRCTHDFLIGLGPSLNHLKTGFGLATLLWFIEQEKAKGDHLEKYDRSGTIADYLVTILCDDPTLESTISTHMATSWGAVKNTWPVDHRLLPKIVEPGTIIGQWQKSIPVFIGLGDLQCSVFSCQPGENQGIVNISTSAQLAVTIHRDQISNDDSKLNIDRPPSSMCVPYFYSKDLLVAASLNGGNVLSTFVHMVHSWQNALIDPSAIPSIDHLWSRLIDLALQSPSMSMNHFSAALFGERHDPSMSAFVTNIRSINISQLNNIGTVFRSICHWIIENLFQMLGKDAANIESIIGAGSALMRNSVLQQELRQCVRDQLVLNDHCDSAYGAALFASMQ